MYLKKLTGISLIALGALSPLMADVKTVNKGVKRVAASAGMMKDMDDIPAEATDMINTIIKERDAVQTTEDQFKQLVERLVQKGIIVPIDALVADKTQEYANAWAEISALNAAYEAAQNGFASDKKEPEEVKTLRGNLAKKQAEYDDLEYNDASPSLVVQPNAGKLNGQIALLEGKNQDLSKAIEVYNNIDRVTKGKIKGLESKAKRGDKRLAGFIETQETLLSENNLKIEKAQQEIKNNETEIQDLKAESEKDSGLSKRPQGLSDKRLAKQLVEKEIKRIKADLKIALKTYSTGRVNKKAVNQALSNVVEAYTQFVQKFVGSAQGSQNCLPECTKMLLAKTEEGLTNPTGTCTAGSLPPEMMTDSDGDIDDRGHVPNHNDALGDETDTKKTSEAPSLKLNSEETRLIGQISSLMNSSKNTTSKHKKLLLSRINITKNLSTIKALSTDNRLDKAEQETLKNFIKKYSK